MIDARNYVAAENLKDGTPVTIRAIGKDDKNGLRCRRPAMNEAFLRTGDKSGPEDCPPRPPVEIYRTIATMLRVMA